jgi:hypothetical protein
VRRWEVDGRIEADSRYPRWLLWAWRQAWIPTSWAGALHDFWVKALR